MCNAELFQEMEAFAFVERRSVQEGGHGEVFQYREALEEVRVLKNDADVLAAKSVALGLGHPIQCTAVDVHRALSRLQHATEQMQQGGLSAPRRTEQEQLSLRGALDIREGQQWAVLLVLKCEVAGADHRSQNYNAGRLRRDVSYF